MNKAITFLSTLALVGALSSCQCSRNKTTGDFEDDAQGMGSIVDKVEAQDDLNKSKTILYTLPAPVEISTLIKEAGVPYDDGLLNDISKADKYITNRDMALNLGIYSTDMSFANAFGQSQVTVDYIGSLKQLTESLGITQLLDEETINRVESQNTTRQEMLNIISEVYMNAYEYLNENNRKNIAVCVLVGGWTEGLYIALNTLNTMEGSTDKLAERIVAQKLALATVINILQTTNDDQMDEDLNYVEGKMREIQEIFDQVKLETSERVTSTTDVDAKLTTIKVVNKTELQPDVLKQLTDKVNEIRAEFVK